MPDLLVRRDDDRQRQTPQREDGVRTFMEETM